MESIRDQVISDWKASEKDRIARDRATALADLVRRGESLSALATKERLDVRATKALSRYDSRANIDISGELLAKIFSLGNIGEVASGPTAQGTGHTIAILRRIDRVTDASDDQPDRREMHSNLKDAIANDILAQYRVALGQEYDVEVNQRAIDSLF
jgi:hypothetical protein